MPTIWQHPDHRPIGNVIQKQFLVVRTTWPPRALGLGLMGLILVGVLMYTPRAGHGGPGMTTRRGCRAGTARRNRVRSRPKVGRHLAAHHGRTGTAVPVRADLGDRAVLVQRPGGQVQLHLAGLHPGQLGRPVRSIRRSAEALKLSLNVALVSTLIRAGARALLAIALVRQRFARTAGRSTRS